MAAADGTLLARCRLRDTRNGGRHPRVIKRAIKRVMSGRQPAQLTIVGLGAAPGRWFRRNRIAGEFSFIDSSEAESVLATAGQRRGLVVVAGTGARVAAHGVRGRYTSLDALGPMLGDTGSGYYIGRETLRTVARDIQLQRPSTPLRRRVLRACGCRDLGDLIHFSLKPRDRSRIASLAKIVDDEARAGDATARQLLREAAQAMAGTVRTLVQHLGIARMDAALIGAGSVATCSEIYWRELCRQVRAFAPRFKLQRITLPPVAGLAAIGLQDPVAIRKLFTNLKNT